ncbi:uncharacterized protein ARMOST_03172 [Armillaria ostoyae]|uniref:Uncharacterized protein n=1 Tax=Armillaria ostoyae TaxID=47428 RepID=A0A284QTY7_ARMOS|nr:uncharacterized protein ARMOST_03172 [Armillaria ostoyae]
MEPKTKREAELLAALHISEQTNQIYQRRMIELQATNILNEVYCKALREQLAFREAKKSRKGKGRLMGDGLLVLLTSDFFYERVVEFEEEQQRKQREKEERQMGKEERKKALTVWEEKVAKRQKILKWASDKKKDKVKGRFTGVQPKLGMLPPAIPKPKVNAEVPESSGSDDEADDEGETDIL